MVELTFSKLNHFGLVLLYKKWTIVHWENQV